VKIARAKLRCVRKKPCGGIIIGGGNIGPMDTSRAAASSARPARRTTTTAA